MSKSTRCATRCGSIEETGWKRRIVLIAMIALFIILSSGTGSAQMRMMRTDVEPQSVDAEARAIIVDSLTAAFNETYIFLDVALEMEKYVRGEMKKGRYDDKNNVMDFAEALTRDFRHISHDRHITVMPISPATLAMLNSDEDDSKISFFSDIDRLRKSNFNFRKVEILDGNIGYLRFDSFVPAEISGPTAIAAMNYLAWCDALIIDMRYNGGGSPTLIQLITSYFMEERTHLNSFSIRAEDRVDQYWTQTWVPGPKMTDVNLYILTSSYTFSGAEEFAYNLKNLERATLIGETTGGGAHPVNSVVFPDLGIEAMLPFGRAVNPISGTNWEGTGVEPHIQVSADEALNTAYSEAVKNLLENTEDPAQKASYKWITDGLGIGNGPQNLDPAHLKSYAGTYGDRILTVENGTLYYQRGSRPKLPAVSITKTLFRFEQVPVFRLEVVLDGDGNPVKLVGHYDNGTTDESPRTGD